MIHSPYQGPYRDFWLRVSSPLESPGVSYKRRCRRFLLGSSQLAFLPLHVCISFVFFEVCSFVVYVEILSILVL